MDISKEKLTMEIEQARKKLNQKIDEKDSYEKILVTSQELDKLLEQYIVSGF